MCLKVTSTNKTSKCHLLNVPVYLVQPFFKITILHYEHRKSLTSPRLSPLPAPNNTAALSFDLHPPSALQQSAFPCLTLTPSPTLAVLSHIKVSPAETMTTQWPLVLLFWWALKPSWVDYFHLIHCLDSEKMEVKADCTNSLGASAGRAGAGQGWKVRGHQEVASFWIWWILPGLC